MQCSNNLNIFVTFVFLLFVYNFNSWLTFSNGIPCKESFFAPKNETHDDELLVIKLGYVFIRYSFAKRFLKVWTSNRRQTPRRVVTRKIRFWDSQLSEIKIILLAAEVVWSSQLNFSIRSSLFPQPTFFPLSVSF